MLTNELFLKTSFLPILVYDLETFKIAEVNHSAIEHYGYSYEEFINMTIKDLRPASEIPRLHDALKNIDQNQNEIIHDQVYLHRKKDGELIKVEISSQWIDFNNKKYRLVAINDVTVREEVLVKLKQNEKKLIKAQEISNLGYWDMDINLQNLYWSDQVYKIWEVNPNDFQLNYDYFLNSIHPDDKSFFLRMEEIFILDEPVFDFKHRIILPDHSIKWVHERGSVIKNEKGNIIGFEGTVQDITISKLLEKSLEEANLRYKLATKATSDAIWDWDLITNQVTWGEGFETVFGYNLKDHTPYIASLDEHIHPEDLQRVNNSLNTVFNSVLINWQEEYSYRRNDGTYAHVFDKGYVIRNNDGKAIRMVGAMQDISERILADLHLKKINENLQKRTSELMVSNSELEQFAYVASHDLQEPLRMVKSFMKLLEEKYKENLDEKAKTYIHFAVDGATRMEILINNLLQYAVSGISKSDEITDLNKVVSEVVELLKHTIIQKNAVINYTSLPNVTIPAIEAKQIFQNLISNALKYHKEDIPPVIYINATEKKSEWIFSIKDNGIGFSMLYKDKIFDLFRRLHRKNKYSGTGLGLALCKKIIKKNEGEIWVESEEGKGSTFYFNLNKK